ncbi:MAG: DUF4878 domain-containing protein [Bacteroidales bacterium]|jgi:hypothetical protein|nr:DUF4878 domain-containing protein [Bacteroidales bacterium]MBR4638330.1 DUF4878 domain-containing protein [Bacteroidales bacterium]MBR6176076.1 DUF4878 domain-containing protein [Bacteroidales bacterium]MBR6903309.1 DUF4878 domain-containing protein [Bacteroidales bacterium]
MKKIALAIIAITLFTCCGCKQEQKMVEKAAYEYSYAMANYDVDGAAKYATEETKNTTLETAKVLIQKVDSSYIKSDTPAKIYIVDTKIVNDTCAVATYHKITPLKDFSDTLELRKRNGEWYAHVPPRTVNTPQDTSDSKKSQNTKGFQKIKD